MQPGVGKPKQKKIELFCYEGGSCGTLFLVPAKIDSQRWCQFNFSHRTGSPDATPHLFFSMSEDQPFGRTLC
jgi:hypothetical protein